MDERIPVIYAAIDKDGNLRIVESPRTERTQDNHIVQNAALVDNPLDKPGLRLGDWSQVRG